MSPGLIPWPSLSGDPVLDWRADRAVSPGLMPRPSLSVHGAEVHRFGRRLVSPGLMPRPSLSVLFALGPSSVPGGVAGVDAPAFVERRSSADMPLRASRCRRG